MSNYATDSAKEARTGEANTYGEQQARAQYGAGFAPDVQQRATATAMAAQVEAGKAAGLTGYLGSGRDALDGYLRALNDEANAGMLAAELAADLAVLRGCLPETMPRGADAALARLVQDARHARRGLR